MKPGELIDIELEEQYGGGITPAIILEVLNFKEYCDSYDENELEYDVDEAWEHWQKHGPLLVLLHPAKQTPVHHWPGFKKEA
tara:strand:- start:253 stop:498 length:246 start_codon:yes stop_codon:yes gene_type:complete